MMAADIAYTTPLGALPSEPEPVPTEWPAKLQQDRQALASMAAQVTKVKAAQEKDAEALSKQEGRAEGEAAQQVG